MAFSRLLPSRARAVSPLRRLTRSPLRLLPCGSSGSITSFPRCAFLSSISGSSDGASIGGGSSTSPNGAEDDSSVLFGKQQSLQPFVQARIRPGEWDRERTNPLYRPAFVSRARILSAEDFAKRPKVGMEVNFESLQNAMVTLTWMNQDTWQQLYDLYLDLMQTSYEKYSKKDSQYNAGTSHEYILRLLAQRYNITPERAAAIVLLKHNEEQYKREGHELQSDIATYMDQMCQQEIDWAYASFDEQKPVDVPFIEDPVGAEGHVESKQYTTVEDVLDFTQLEKDTKQRLERETQQAIDGHVYKMDQDKASIPVPIDSDCRQLLAVQKKLAQQSLEMTSVKELMDNKNNKQAQQQQERPVAWPRPHHPHISSSNKKGDEPPPPVLERRPRWKFVAQTINTRELKKAQKSKNIRKTRRRQAYCNNDPTNSLVEEDGTLRVATVADVANVAWKPARKGSKFIYDTVQEAWLEHILRNRPHAWGKQQAPVKEEEKTNAAAVAAADDAESETKKDASAEAGEGEIFSDAPNNAASGDKVQHAPVKEEEKTDAAATADDAESETKQDASAETGEGETFSEAPDNSATGDKDEGEDDKKNGK